MNQACALVLEEYKKTIDVAIYEGTTYWQRFNVLFAVNAAVLVFLGAVFQNQMTSPQTENVQRVLIIGTCFVGFISSITMVFSCLRSQMFYRSWWKHIEKLEHTLGFSMMSDLDQYFKRQTFIRQMPVITMSFSVPITFSVLFSVLPVLLYGQVAIAYLIFCVVMIILLLLECYCLASSKKSSQVESPNKTSSNDTSNDSFRDFSQVS